MSHSPHGPLRRGLREQIAAELRNDVVAGRITSDAQLVERKIAARFGVSHAPVREALLQLTQEGLLVSQPHVGVKVAQVPPAPVRDLFVQLRRTVEAFAVKFIFDAIDGPILLHWEELVGLQRQAVDNSDWPKVEELDFAFHESIIQRVGQSDVVQVWRAIFSRSRMFLARRSSVENPLLAICDQHAALIDRCRNHDLQGAYRALDTNLQSELNLR